MANTINQPQQHEHELLSIQPWNFCEQQCQ